MFVNPKFVWIQCVCVWVYWIYVNNIYDNDERGGENNNNQQTNKSNKPNPTSSSSSSRTVEIDFLVVVFLLREDPPELLHMLQSCATDLRFGIQCRKKEGRKEGDWRKGDFSISLVTCLSNFIYIY